MNASGWSPWDTKSHPFLNPDGSTDVRALCRFLDERANHDASTAPNPTPEPAEVRRG